MDITHSEWEELAAKISAKLAARWPWLHDKELRVQTPLLSAHAELRLAELRLSSSSYSMSVHITVDSSGCISGGVAEIANAVRMMSEVRDAMLFVHGETDGIVVWRDGECPCSHCSNRGTTQGRACDRCKGTGKR